jgi:hypothetical protein
MLVNLELCHFVLPDISWLQVKGFLRPESNLRGRLFMN